MAYVLEEYEFILNIQLSFGNGAVTELMWILNCKFC